MQPSQEFTWRRRFFDWQRNCYSFIFASLLLDAILTFDEEFPRAGNEVNNAVQWVLRSSSRVPRYSENLPVRAEIQIVNHWCLAAKAMSRDCGRHRSDLEHWLINSMICLDSSWFLWRKLFPPSVEPLVTTRAVDIFPEVGGSSSNTFSLDRDCRWCKCTLHEAMPESEVDLNCK